MTPGRRGTFRPTVGRSGLFSLQLAEDYPAGPKIVSSASRWPKSTLWLPVGRKVSGAQNVIKMASSEKIINMKNLRLVETVDFDIKIVLIRGRMKPIEPKQCQGQKLQSYFGQTVWMSEKILRDIRCTR